MIEAGFSDVFRIVGDGAKSFGALEASGVWALMFIVMFWERQQIRKQNQKRDDAWLETRTEQAISETKSAEALEKLAVELAKNTDQIARISTIVDERIPRRS